MACRVEAAIEKSGSGKSQVVELFQPLRYLTVNRFPAPINLIAFVLTGCQARITQQRASSLRLVNRNAPHSAALHAQDRFATCNWINHLHTGESVNRSQPKVAG